MIIKKVNLKKLPEMVSELDIDVDGRTICKVFDSNLMIDTDSVPDSKFIKRRATQTTLSKSEISDQIPVTKPPLKAKARPETAKASDAIKARPVQDIKIRPVTAKAAERTENIKLYTSTSSFVEKNREMHAKIEDIESRMENEINDS